MVLKTAPDAARHEQRAWQRSGAETDEIPDAGGAEPRLDEKENNCPLVASARTPMAATASSLSRMA